MGLLQVLQQEEQADQDWALDNTLVPGGPRPRRLRQKWQESVEEAADASLPLTSEYVTGELQRFLDRLRAQVVDDLGAASRNVVSIYPEEYQPFLVSPAPHRELQCRTNTGVPNCCCPQVYLQGYHHAVARRLKSIADHELEISDIYSLLDWLHNTYRR